MPGHRFSVDGSTLRPVDPKTAQLIDLLEPATYSVGCDQFGFFLRRIEDFVLPPKLYGHTTEYAGRIINTFMNREASTGALFTGEKGSGKTLLSKAISIACLHAGIPTLVISSPLCGDGFNRFLAGISQPCVVIFDEYEKVYDKDDQAKLLTLMDGTFNSKKLFILTCNDKWRVDSFMRNRPGRLFYNIDFSGIDEQFIEEYCADNLDVKEHIQSVKDIATMFSTFNFDMLKALVEEMNRYHEPANRAARIMNIKPEMEGGAEYDAVLLFNDKPMPNVKPHKRVTRGNPLMPGFEAYVSFHGAIDPKDAAAVAEFEEFENDANCPIDDFDSNTGQFDINLHVDGGCFLESNKKLGGLVFSAPHDERFKVVFVRRERTAHRYYEQF